MWTTLRVVESREKVIQLNMIHLAVGLLQACLCVNCGTRKFKQSRSLVLRNTETTPRVGLFQTCHCAVLLGLGFGFGVQYRYTGLHCVGLKNRYSESRFSKTNRLPAFASTQTPTSLFQGHIRPNSLGNWAVNVRFVLENLYI